jgi:hypothetical protein
MAANSRAISAVKSGGAEWAGMKETIALLAYMSSREKNSVVRASYMIATKAYRRELKSKTPVSSANSIKGFKQLRSRSKSEIRRGKLGKKKNSLKQSVGVLRSRKYGNRQNIIDPVWVGHMVKKGAASQHFVVRGTKSIRQDGSPLSRSRAGGGRDRKKTMRIRTSNGNIHTLKRKASAPNPYIDRIASRYKPIITSQFGDSFILAMRKYARRRYPEYFR